MRIEQTFLGADGKPRRLIKVIEDGSVVFVGGEFYAKDFQTQGNDMNKKGGNETNDKTDL